MLPTLPLSVALLGLTRGGLREQISWAASAGFRAVQINAAAPSTRPRDLGRSARRDLASLLRRLELASSGVDDLFVPPDHLTHPARRSRGRARSREAIDFAADLTSLAGGHPVLSTELPPGDAGRDAVRYLAEHALSRRRALRRSRMAAGLGIRGSRAPLRWASASTRPRCCSRERIPPRRRRAWVPAWPASGSLTSRPPGASEPGRGRLEPSGLRRRGRHKRLPRVWRAGHARSEGPGGHHAPNSVGDGPLPNDRLTPAPYDCHLYGVQARLLRHPRHRAQRKRGRDQVRLPRARTQFHPDVNKAKDAPQKFNEVQEAYEILSDVEKRKLYDQFGHAGVGAAASRRVVAGPAQTETGSYTWSNIGPRPRGGGAGAGGSDFDIGSIFEEIFGRSGGPAPPERPGVLRPGADRPAAPRHTPRTPAAATSPMTSPSTS